MTEYDDRSVRDGEHLKVLAICNYVFGGLVGLYALMNATMWSTITGPQFQRAMDDAMRRQNEDTQAPQVHLEVDQVVNIFQSVMIVLTVLAAIAALLSILNGRFLQKRRHRGFSMVVAALQCLAIPLGTILGIFTFVVLGRTSVAEGYQRTAPPR